MSHRGEKQRKREGKREENRERREKERMSGECFLLMELPVGRHNTIILLCLECKYMLSNVINHTYLYSKTSYLFYVTLMASKLVFGERFSTLALCYVQLCYAFNYLFVGSFYVNFTIAYACKSYLALTMV